MRLAMAVLLVTAGTACKHNKRANTTVIHRAAFDFPCDPSRLSLTVLDTEGARKMASQIGVYGCEKKAVYVYYPDADTWLLDGAVSPTEAGYQPAAHVTTGKNEKRSEKKSGRGSKKAEKRGGMEPVESAPVAPMPAGETPLY